MNDFSANSTYHIIHKLLGEIEPIGETNYDNKCMTNIEKYCDLIYMLLDDIHTLIPYKDRYEYSRQIVGKYAEDFCESICENIKEWIENYKSGYTL